VPFCGPVSSSGFLGRPEKRGSLRFPVACSISAWKREIIRTMYPDNGLPQWRCRTIAIPLAAAALQFPLAHPAVASAVTGMRSAGEIAQNIDLMCVEMPRESGHALRRANLLFDAAAVPQ
jgi:hypothetical protein